MNRTFDQLLLDLVRERQLLSSMYTDKLLTDYLNKLHNLYCMKADHPFLAYALDNVPLMENASADEVVRLTIDSATSDAISNSHRSVMGICQCSIGHFVAVKGWEKAPKCVRTAGWPWKSKYLKVAGSGAVLNESFFEKVV